jgi:hypothetical protein
VTQGFTFGFGWLCLIGSFGLLAWFLLRHRRDRAGAGNSHLNGQV